MARIEQLKSLRENVNWKIERERRQFIREFFPLICNWEGPFPNLQVIFQREARGRLRNTLLHLAAAGGQLILVELLLKSQADPNSQNEEGSTPLHVICKRDVDGGLAKTFFKVTDEMNKQVRIDAQDKNGNSPLHLALSRCLNHDLVQVLLSRGSDPNLANKQKQTPLHLVCSRDHKDNTAYLFFEMCELKKKPVKVDAEDNQGRTPLQLAVANLLMQEVNLLLNYGADPSKFVFPSRNDFHEALGYREDDDLFTKGYRVSRALEVLKILELWKYTVDLGDAVTIITLFQEWGFFQMVTDPEKVWRNKTQPKNSDFYSSDESIRKAAHIHWFKTTTREFFQKWTGQRLEELCAKNVKNLHNVNLASTI